MANGLKLVKFVDEQRHSSNQAGKRPFDLATNPLSGAWRLATQWARHLPTTVIVGAQHAGTTQLYASMVEHPRCFGSADTKVDFFSKHPTRPVAHYRSQFPWKRRVWRRQGHVLEASPSYLGT